MDITLFNIYMANFKNGRMASHFEDVDVKAQIHTYSILLFFDMDRQCFSNVAFFHLNTDNLL